MKSKILVLALIIVLAITLCGCEELNTPLYESGSVTKENMLSILEKLNIKVSTTNLVRGEIPDSMVKQQDSNTANLFLYELPDISNYEPDVTGNGEVDVEIFVPLEDNGSSIRKLVDYVANSFNQANDSLEDGRTVSVTVRSLEASLAEEYILNGVYYPKGYIAANELYGILMQENGIEVSQVTNKTFGNTMGVLISKAKYEEMEQKYGEVTINTFVKANEAGDIAVGYTNPTNNPTGLNFVVSMLSYFDASNPASMEATTDFSNFQNMISSVSFSTEQMKNSVAVGVIDSFVMERQAYEADEMLKSEFRFMPFGVRHDNPLYAVAGVTPEEREVLKMFAEYCNTSEMQAYASTLGFNQDESYTSTVATYSGGMISEILNFWKQEKSSGKQIVVVFVADKSGSMSSHNKLEALKASLKNAMQYVGANNKIGLISFDNNVYIDLPIDEFDTEYQEYYIGAIDSWRADGGTATNNALLIALKLLREEEIKNPDMKPFVFLLSDGQTQSGYSLSSVKELIHTFDIPIYTIGYEADVKELQAIAEINQGAFMNATSDDLGYVLKTLFDAEM